MKKKRSLIFVFKKSFLYGPATALMLMLAFCSSRTVPAAKAALRLCAENIIPSLFPFFVLSRILIKTGFAKVVGRFLSPLMRPLFKVSGTGGVAFFIGIISGYPMGAKTVCDLYESGNLEKSEAERLLPCCNNSGPLFVIGAVGSGMLASVKAGMFLYAVHIVSAILTGFALRFFCRTETIYVQKKLNSKNTSKSLELAFSESMKDAVNSILLICGYIVFFASVTAPFTVFAGNGALASILKGILEVTGGAQSVALNYSFFDAIPVISALLGFGGLCVALQVMGIVKKSSLSMKPYIFGKLHQSVISYILCRIVLSKTLTVSTFKASEAVNFETGNLGAAITAVFIICAFYFSILALRKNFKKY